MKLVREHINEAIKHLVPRTKEEIKNSMIGYGVYDIFFTSIKENLVSELEELINSENYKDLSNNDIRIGFVKACYYGHTEIVKLLIEKGGADPRDVNLEHVDVDLIPIIKQYRKKFRKKYYNKK